MQFDMKVMLREHWPICQTRFTSHSQVQQERCALLSVSRSVAAWLLLVASPSSTCCGVVQWRPRLAFLVRWVLSVGRAGSGRQEEGGRSCEKRRRLSRSRRRWQELLGPSYSASSSTNWYSLDDIAVGSDTIVDFANPRSTQLAQPKILNILL